MAALTLDELIAASQQGRTVCHWTMIADYDPSTHVFTRADGAVTAFISIEPFAALHLADTTLAQHAETLAHALGAVQTGEMVSYHLLRSRHVDAAVESYRSLIGRQLPLLQLWRQTRADFVQRGADEPLLSGAGMGADLHTRTLRIVLSLTIPPARPLGLRTGVMDALGLRIADTASQQRYRAARTELIERLHNRMAVISAKLQVIGCRCHPIDEPGYLALVREMLYPRWSGRVLDGDQRIPLYARMPIADVVADPRQGCLWADGVCLKAATLRGHPARVHPGMLSLPHRSLGGLSFLDSLEAGWMTVTARALGIEGTRFALQNLTTNIRGGFVLPGRVADQRADAARAQMWLESEGRRFFDVETVVTVWGDGLQEAESRLRKVRDQLSEVVARTDIERYAAPAFILRALPGNACPPVGMLDRRVTMVDRQLGDLLPVYYRSRGTSEALMLLHGQTGEPFPFSPWGGSSQGTLVAGQPGQGKSVLVQCLALDLLCQADSQVIVLDTGRSYLPLCLLFEERGQYLECGSGHCCINPLAGIQAANGLAALSLLEAACSRPGCAPLSPAQVGLLSSSLTELYEAHQESTTFHERADLGDPAMIVRAVKTLRTSLVTEAQQRLIAAGGQDDTITVLYQYRVASVTIGGPAGATLSIASGRDLPIATGAFLRGAGIRWTDDDGGCVLLSSSAQMTATLLGQGISAELDRASSLVEVATEDDVARLEGVGVAFPVPAALAADPDSARMPAVVADAAVARSVQVLGGADVYRTTLGTATIQREVRIGDLGRLLEDHYQSAPTPQAYDLIQRLQPYYGGRAYARFFDGPTSMALTDHLMVDIELGTLMAGTDPHLFSLVVSAILHHVSCHCTREATRHLRKLVIIEEAAQLLGAGRGPGGRGGRDGGSVIGERIDTLYRTGRKHGVAVTLVTQGVTDLIEHPVGAAILEQCVIKLILAQSETAIARIAEALRLTGEQTAMLSSLSSQPGYYSQVLVISSEHAPRIFDVALNILHPIQYWMTTTRPDEVLYREDLLGRDPERHQQSGQARLRTVIACAGRYPHGLPQHGSEEAASWRDRC